MTEEKWPQQVDRVYRHKEELVLQNGSRLIFAGAGRWSPMAGVIWETQTIMFDEIHYSDSWSHAWMAFRLDTVEREIRDAVVRNLGIEPQDEVYLAIKRLVEPKRSIFLTADFSQLEKRVLAHYYGMSPERFRQEYEQDPYSNFFYRSGSVTGRVSDGDRSNFYDRFEHLDTDANGLRRGRFEGMCSVTGRFPSQDPAQSPPVRKNQSRFRKLPPLD